MTPTEAGLQRCPLCGAPAVFCMSLLQTTVWECTGGLCGLRFAAPQPDESALSRAYTDLYYANEAPSAGQLENTPAEIIDQVFRKLEPKLGTLRGKTVLDYGCGRGILLRTAQQLGLEIHGVEPDPVARTVAARLPGVHVYRSVEDLLSTGGGQRFDLITLWTVIEHLRVPWDDLSMLRSLLKPDGWLLINTMDIRCLRARIEGRQWENYANPTHLFYFDRLSLERAIQESGFREYSRWRVKIRYPFHSPMRRLLYEISFRLGISDGLFYLCKGSNHEHNDSREIAPVAFAGSNASGGVR